MTTNEKERVLESIRQHVGVHLSVLGVTRSMTESLVANPGIVRPIASLYQDLYDYLDTTGILENEIKQLLNVRFHDNMAILGLIQQQTLAGRDRRDALLSTDVDLRKLNQTFSFEEAKRYVKYAIAVYGDSIIQATNVDAYGKVDFSVTMTPKQHIAQHINIPECDLIQVDTEYSADAKQLRHFLAVDHVNRKVVLAIRGTFTHSEIAVDLSGYSRKTNRFFVHDKRPVRGF